jgi:hypothetical protein
MRNADGEVSGKPERARAQPSEINELDKLELALVPPSPRIE